MNQLELLSKVFELKRLSWDELSQVEEFKCLVGSPENQEWHQEGSADKHVDLMLDIFFGGDYIKELETWDAVALYLAILFHDFRKPQTLSKDENGIYHNYGHELQGARYFWDFIQQSGIVEAFRPEIRKTLLSLFLTVSKMIQWHMFKNLSDWKTDRAELCLSSFRPSELILLRHLHDIDMRGAITKLPRKTNLFELDNKKLVHNYSPGEKNPRRLVVLIGPAGAGKSTFIKGLIWTESPVTVVSTDQLREELFGDVNVMDRNGLLFTTAYKRVEEALAASEPKIVVYDATNLTFKNRKPVSQIGKKFNVPITYFVFLTSLEQCLANQHKRERQVPEEVVKKHYESLEIPCFLEASKIYHICNGTLF